jgi:hypothetical protein
MGDPMRAAYLALLALLMLVTAPAALDAGAGSADRRANPELAVPGGARAIHASSERARDPLHRLSFVLPAAPALIPPPLVRAERARDVEPAPSEPPRLLARSRAPPAAPRTRRS